VKLTSYSDYALRVLIYLSVQDDRLATIKEISEQYEISKNHLTKLVHDLAQQGFVETVRGKNGGLRIGRDPATITVGSVVRAMEKDLTVVECFDPGNQECKILKACILAGALKKALGAFLEVLDGYTIQDLVKPKDSLVSTFPIDVWSDKKTSVA